MQSLALASHKDYAEVSPNSYVEEAHKCVKGEQSNLSWNASMELLNFLDYGSYLACSNDKPVSTKVQ